MQIYTTSVFVFRRCFIILLLFRSCDGRPASFYDSDDFEHNREEESRQLAWPTFSGLMMVMLATITASIAVFALLCTWCRLVSKGTIRTSNNNNGMPVAPLNNEDEYTERMPSTEFTIFPPDSGRHLVDQMGSESVKFEPLPDIRLRSQMGYTNVQKPRPAPFNSVVGGGLSFQDWFDEPHSNFPRTQLQYVDELGSGWFGQVVEGGARDILPTQKKTKVVVKILMGAANTTDQMNFLHEVKHFRDVTHPNVLKLLGKCLETDPFLIILEYCAFKDLKSYLIQHRTESESLLQKNLLLQMVCNVAAGLQHLHEKGFILTDLAARNCLLTSDLIVKVGDYGNGIELFKDDYYCAGGIAVPVRWCAPETLRCTETIMETKEVTREANVWSFGVVLWEILEFGKLPYMELSDDELIQKVIIEGSEHLKKPLTACSHRDQLFMIIQRCQLNHNCRPNMNRIVEMLTDLSSHPDTVDRDPSSSFEARWNVLEPRRSLSKSVSSSAEWQSGDKLFSSPHLSSSCDSDLQQSITSPSLQNLRGSLDDLNSASANVVDDLSSSLLDQQFVVRPPKTDRDGLLGGSLAMEIDHDFVSNQSAAKCFMTNSDRSSEKEVSPFTREVDEVIRKFEEDLDREYQTSEGERDLSEDTKNDCSLLSDEQYGASMTTCSEIGLESLGEIINAGSISIRDDDDHRHPEESGEDGGGGYRDSLSDEENASWKKIVESSHEESGEITRIIREKSQSVQDFLKLTVIDSESGSGSDSDGVVHGTNSGGGGRDDCLVENCSAGEEEKCQEEEQQVQGITSNDMGDVVNSTSGGCVVADAAAVLMSNGDGMVCLHSGHGPVSSSHETVADYSSITTTTTTIYADASITTYALDNFAWKLVRSAASDALRDATADTTLLVGAPNVTQRRSTNGLSVTMGNIGCLGFNSCPPTLTSEAASSCVRSVVPEIVVEEIPSNLPLIDDDDETITYLPKSDLNFRFVFKNLDCGGYDDYFSDEVRSEWNSASSSVEVGNNDDGCDLSIFSATPMQSAVTRQRTSTPRVIGEDVSIDLTIDDDSFGPCESCAVESSVFRPDTTISSAAKCNSDTLNDVFDDLLLSELVPEAETRVVVVSQPSVEVPTVNGDCSTVPLIFVNTTAADSLYISSSSCNSNPAFHIEDASLLQLNDDIISGPLSAPNYIQETTQYFVADETAAIGDVSARGKNTPGDHSDLQSTVSACLLQKNAHGELDHDGLSSDEGFEASEMDDSISPVDHSCVSINAISSSNVSETLVSQMVPGVSGESDEEEGEEEILLVDLETNKAVLMDSTRPKSRLSFSRDDVVCDEDSYAGFNSRIASEVSSCHQLLATSSGSRETSRSSSRSECDDFYEEGTKDSTDVSSSSSPECGSKKGSDDSSNYSESTEDDFYFMKSQSEQEEVESMPLDDGKLTEVQLRRTSKRDQRNNRTRFEVHKIPEETLDYLAQLSSPTTTNNSDLQMACSNASLYTLSTSDADHSDTATSTHNPVGVVMVASESNHTKDFRVEELQLRKLSTPLLDLDQETDATVPQFKSGTYSSSSTFGFNSSSSRTANDFNSAYAYGNDPIASMTTVSGFDKLRSPPPSSSVVVAVVTAASESDQIDAAPLATSPHSPVAVVTVAAESDNVKNVKVEELRLCKLSSPLLGVDTTMLRDSDSAAIAASPAWESGTDSSSSSSSCLSPSSSSTSGEFDCSKPIGYSVYMEERARDAYDVWIDEEDDDDESNAAHGTDETEGELEPFQISTWNKNLTPTKGLLRTPDKKLHQSEEKKVVSFKFSKRSVVYEYPKEEVEEVDGDDELDEDSRSLWSCQVYGSGMDYSSYADWELADEEMPDDMVEVEGFEDGSDNSDDFTSSAVLQHNNNNSHHYGSSGPHQLYKLSNIGDDDNGSDYSSECGVATSYYSHPDSFDFATYLAHYNAGNPYNSPVSGNPSTTDEDFWLETILNTNDFFVNGGDGPLEFSVDSLDRSGLPQWALNPSTINMYGSVTDDDRHRYEGYTHDNSEETDDDGDNGASLIDFETNLEVEGDNGRHVEPLMSAEPWTEADNGESEQESDSIVAVEANDVGVVHLENGVSKEFFLNGNCLMTSALIGVGDSHDGKLNNLSNAKLSNTTDMTIGSSIGVIQNDSSHDSEWRTPVRKLATDSNATINCNSSAAVVAVESGTAAVLR